MYERLVQMMKNQYNTLIKKYCNQLQLENFENYSLPRVLHNIKHNIPLLHSDYMYAITRGITWHGYTLIQNEWTFDIEWPKY